jgi:polyisoprenoid-binding protein YceI
LKLAQAAPADAAEATRYSVDSAASMLHILVYRGGALARMGHNHVVSSEEVSGQVIVHQDFSRSSVELTVPVKTFIVDDAKARAAEGPDFAAVVPQDARDGTRGNLLRREVLDGERYPKITLQSVAVAGSRAKPTLTMRITIKDVSRDVEVPTSVEEQDGKLIATGEVAIKQTDFGIKPFSVALGALQVVDQLKVKFRLVAIAAPKS